MNNLKDRLIRLGSQSPELQKHIRPVLDKIAMTGIQKELDYAKEEVFSLKQIYGAGWQKDGFEDDLFLFDIRPHESSGAEWKIQRTTPNQYTITGPDRQEDMVEEGEVSSALLSRVKSWIR